MSTEQNKSIVRRWVEEGWNKRNTALIDQLFTPNFYQHETGPETVNSSETLKPFVAGYLSAFPDLQFTIEDLIAEGDKVVWRFKATGNNTGPFMGGPVTGKSIAVTGTITFRLEDSRMAEAWLNLDVLGLLQQVGIIPVAA
jgi:steroid delta-isomerase-like uncharacterized protein